MTEIIGKYRHYKGEVYEVLGEAIHSETEEKMVIYQKNKTIFVRPYNMFFEKVEVEGTLLPRFKKIE